MSDDGTRTGRSEGAGQRFDRLPATEIDRHIENRPTREGVVDFFRERYGIPTATFHGCTFWEKGRGKIWIVRGDVPSPIRVEGLGLFLLRTRGADWKPTTNGVTRFGQHATRNVLELDRPAAARFFGGEDQPVDWTGDRGYLIVATEIAGDSEPLGVGLYVDGVLRSQVPKGRRRKLSP